jgi:SAM-dependent methyltransferase
VLGGDPERIVAAEREIRDRQAPVYDLHREREVYERLVEDAVVFGALDLGPELVVVDAGCGTGGSLTPLLERCARVIGVDHSEASLEVARNRVPEELRSRLELVPGDLRSVPLADRTADRVMSMGVIQHVPTDAYRRQVMEELYRVLKPDGILVVDAYRWLGHVRRHKEGFWPSGLYRYAFTAREFRALFLRSGFREVRVGGAVIAPALSERLGVSVETQQRLAFTPLGRHLAHYVVGRGRRPAG